MIFMNPKNSRCMNRMRHILLLASLLCSMTAGAQSYEQVVRQNFWNASQNITGVRQDRWSSSYAEVVGEFETGGFRDSWQATEGWSIGAATASIRHLERMTLRGSFSFMQTEGYGMCGSMFINPGYYPVDVLEFTPGRKTLQTYAFDGGISYDLTKKWRIGAMMDFESANIAKRKDLRHSNWMLDMKVAPGVMYRNGDWAFGANYIYMRTTESVEAEQIGVSESSYYAFLNKGLMYGAYNIWTGSALHLNESGVKGLPVKEQSHGLATQVQYKGFFAEAEYHHSAGVIGEKEYIWFLFPGNSAGLRMAYRIRCANAWHYARLDFGWNGRTMDETVLEKVTEGGVSNVINHGQNKILSQRDWRLNPEYEYLANRWNVIAKAEIGVKEESVSQMYPYVSWQSLLNYSADVRVKYHWTSSLEMTVNVGYGAGKVVEDFWLTDEQAGVQTTPFRLQEYYDWQMEYAAAARLKAGLALKWSFWKGLYVKANGSLTHAFDLKYIIGKNRIGTSITIGYDF